ncbi:MAG TPA: TetR/AcrR family transcriptional regulator [Cryomorphaceae bacterium]|nr:TetR/AcrR family transcriptional regulator [Cryomorphaceae bacterium]HKL39744.1 TetR/AcrR family transcriptional regulator [Cryomorphaceae bacterium]
MSNSSEKEKKIVADAIKVFMTYGIKSVTMDDIAKHMRMSKKTLYQYVSDKNDLVTKCTNHDCQITEVKVKEILSKGLNAIEENFEISKHIVEDLKDIHPSIFYDLEKYYPEAWNKMHQLRHEFVGVVMKENMERGIEQGLYRKDLNVKLMTQLWVARLNIIFDPSIFSLDEYSLADVYRQMFMHHVRGIASNEGLKYIEKNQHKLN